jgi:hypothetical protein
MREGGNYLSPHVGIRQWHCLAWLVYFNLCKQIMSNVSYGVLQEKAKELYISHPYKKDNLIRGTIFFHGASWMAELMGVLREDTKDFPYLRSYTLYGIFKYALAGFSALFFLLSMVFLKVYYLFPVLILVFYLVEAQFIFLFPLLIDHSASPVSDSFRMTRRAGGTLSVMRTLLPIALYMLSGGLTWKRFMKNWTIGCIMMVVWYEEIRRHSEESNIHSPTGNEK